MIPDFRDTTNDPAAPVTLHMDDRELIVRLLRQVAELTSIVEGLSARIVEIRAAQVAQVDQVAQVAQVAQSGLSVRRVP